MYPSTRILSYGDQIKPGNYLIHSSFNRVQNFFNSEEQLFISLVDSEVGGGPFNIVFENYQSFPIKQLTVKDDKLSFNEVSFKLSSELCFQSKLTSAEINPEANIVERLSYLEKLLLSFAHQKSLVFLLSPDFEFYFTTDFEKEIVRRFKQALPYIQSGNLSEVAKRVYGLGWGLTPSGNDLLAGLIMAEQILKISHPVDDEPSLLLANKNNLSDFLLWQTLQGFYSQKWKKLLHDFFYYSPNSMTQSLAQILKIGSTSGADTATGFILGMKRGLNGNQMHH